MVFEHDIASSFELGTDEVHQQGYLHLNHVHESSSSTGPEVQIPYNWYVTEEEKNSKIQLRYNWHVTEEEEVESCEVNVKENHLSNMSLTI
ncbi:TIR-NBS-LRR type disease resistance protein [Trifolium medium]|uniref:TIR-NBS-LRR type disease resistance protein n=1 Tax=Trifolium medium TaxID=97028 RepID=A0A392M4X4_9FABA|nr:TIR-NBS-LRR type disease resistance protein [Trifolium medium]